MSNSKKTQKTAPLAHRIPAEVSPVIAAYSAWLEEQTGYKVDPMSVYLGSQLRGTFQKSEGNQQRIAQAKAARDAEAAAKAARKAEREKAAQEKAAAKEPTPAVRKTKAAPKAPAKPVRQRATKPATPATKPAPRRRPAKPAPAAPETTEAVQA